MEIKITVFAAVSACVCVPLLSSAVVKCNHGAAWFVGRIIKQDMSHTHSVQIKTVEQKEGKSEGRKSFGLQDWKMKPRYTWSIFIRPHFENAPFWGQN